MNDAEIFEFTDQHEFVSSGWIRKAYYNRARSRMAVAIVGSDNDLIYIYEGVSLATWDNFKNAHSAGAFYNTGISGYYQRGANNDPDGIYHFVDVSGPTISGAAPVQQKSAGKSAFSVRFEILGETVTVRVEAESFDDVIKDVQDARPTILGVMPV